MTIKTLYSIRIGNLFLFKRKTQEIIKNSKKRKNEPGLARYKIKDGKIILDEGKSKNKS